MIQHPASFAASLCTLLHKINGRANECAILRSLKYNLGRVDHRVSSRPVPESRSAPIWTKIIVATLSPRLCHAWRVPR